VALYIPASRRRRRNLYIGIGALVLGLALGALFGRASAPTITDKVHSVQSEARRTAASLRVIAVHDESGAISTQGNRDAGIALVLSNTRKDLKNEFSRAVWLAPEARSALLDELDALEAMPDHGSAKFGAAADKLAGNIESTFGTA
jgi:hypothetical protein